MTIDPKVLDRIEFLLTPRKPAYGPLGTAERMEREGLLIKNGPALITAAREAERMRAVVEAAKRMRIELAQELSNKVGHGLTAPLPGCCDACWSIIDFDVALAALKEQEQ